MPRYFGLDLHKEYVHGCEWFPDLGKGRHFRFPNTLESWQAFIASEVDETSKIALEVTGNAFQVYDLLSKAAGQVVMANPTEMKRLGSGRHTDSVDAERLAKMLILGTLPAVWVPPQDVREMRALVSHREQLVRQRTRCQNVAKAILRRNGHCLGKDQDVRAWLAVKRKELRLGGADLAIVTSTVRMLGYINEEIAAIEGEIGWRAAGNREIRLLMSITGVGLIAASVIWARIGNASRFRGAKAVSRYSGLDPSVHQSGEEDHRGHISKNGASDLRRVLVQAAYQAALHDSGPLGRFFWRKEKQLGRKRAVIATARKILVTAWKMLLTGETYCACKAVRYHEKLRVLKRLADERPYDAWAALEALLERTYLQPDDRERRSLQNEVA